MSQDASQPSVLDRLEQLLDQRGIHNLLSLLGRFLLVHVFLLSGAMKFLAWEQSAQFFQELGLPVWVLPIAGAWELGFAVIFLLGWRARLAALALAGFAGMSTLIGHSDWSDPMEMYTFMKNYALVGGLLLVAAVGPGSLALGGKRGQ